MPRSPRHSKRPARTRRKSKPTWATSWATSWAARKKAVPAAAGTPTTVASTTIEPAGSNVPPANLPLYGATAMVFSFLAQLSAIKCNQVQSASPFPPWQATRPWLGEAERRGQKDGSRTFFCLHFSACRLFGSSLVAGGLALKMREFFLLVIFTCTDL